MSCCLPASVLQNNRSQRIERKKLSFAFKTSTRHNTKRFSFTTSTTSTHGSRVDVGDDYEAVVWRKYHSLLYQLVAETEVLVASKTNKRRHHVLTLYYAHSVLFPAYFSVTKQQKDKSNVCFHCTTDEVNWERIIVVVNGKHLNGLTILDYLYTVYTYIFIKNTSTRQRERLETWMSSFVSLHSIQKKHLTK